MPKITKRSEAKILVFLENAELRFKYARQISFKLNMDYAYLLGRLKDLREKGWIKPIYRENKVFYELKLFVPLTKAKELLAK